ncbi:hypothetical protein LTR53_001149 [Teratosphaeriaceae sp. CCFEE 6253]|nr:hypothetical protein LTR53_001149 [Teratosphaeriaceae sp. CCFEE 6253]
MPRAAVKAEPHAGEGENTPTQTVWATNPRVHEDEIPLFTSTSPIFGVRCGTAFPEPMESLDAGGASSQRIADEFEALSDRVKALEAEFRDIRFMIADSIGRDKARHSQDHVSDDRDMASNATDPRTSTLTEESPPEPDLLELFLRTKSGGAASELDNAEGKEFPSRSPPTPSVPGSWDDNAAGKVSEPPTPQSLPVRGHRPVTLDRAPATRAGPGPTASSTTCDSCDTETSSSFKKYGYSAAQHS